jgi:hypothetical protein
MCVCPTLRVTVCYSYLYFISSACECLSAVMIFLVLNDSLLFNHINVLCIFKHVSERSNKLLIYLTYILYPVPVNVCCDDFLYFLLFLLLRLLLMLFLCTVCLLKI